MAVPVIDADHWMADDGSQTCIQNIDGPWVEELVLDRHVISSRPVGYVGEHLQFETTRSSLGALV